MSSNLSQKSMLIIEGCDFLDHHVVSQLLECHAQVSILNFKLNRNRIDSVNYHSADISKKANVETVITRVRPQIIIHTTSPPAMSTDSALYHRVNVNGTRNLLKCGSSMKIVEAFVYTSSASVVHDSVSDLTDADETFPVLYIPDQKKIYNHTKTLTDDLVRAANDSSDANDVLATC